MDKKSKNRLKIGRAAMQCFAKYGLEKTTLDDIANAVGLNKSSLYYYYKNKEDIFLDTAMREGEEYINKLQVEAYEKEGLLNQVWYYMHTRFEYYRNILTLNNISTASLNRILPGFFELYEALRTKEKVFIASLIKKGIDNGEIKDCDTKEIASVLINLSDALKHSIEQRAIISGEESIDYSPGLADMKLLVTLVFKGLE